MLEERRAGMDIDETPAEKRLRYEINAVSDFSSNRFGVFVVHRDCSWYSRRLSENLIQC